MKADQSVDLNVRFATDPTEILESGEPLIMCLLKGIAIDVKSHLWKKLSDILMKILENGELPADILPFVGGISPLLLLKLNAHLDLEIDDKMKEAIASNPIAEPLMMDASTLVMSASQVHSDDDEELEEYLKEKFDPIQLETLKFFIKHLGDEVDVSFVHQRAGIKARLTSKSGLNLLLKNILRF